MSTPSSFESDSSNTATGPKGQIAHRAHLAHSDRLANRLYAVGADAWCHVGNGLSNQTFVRGPQGIIAIDTGESIQEMQGSLEALQAVADEPVVAVLYSHFHYVQGTKAVLGAGEDARPIPIWGHAKIAGNLLRAATDIAPTYVRGIVEQFGVVMPSEGPDGLANVGLGMAFRFPHHAPSTPGFLVPTDTFDAACVIEVAGLEIHVTPAPSDADDSVTFWFPSLKLAVHNIVWPTLFNVFAIRGEEYRDPRVLLEGLDHLRSLGAEHLIATHGPPMSGVEEITKRVTRYRDSIQFMWDQTVRWTNRGATSEDLAHLVHLPSIYDDDYLTTELYGVVEHHVRQIRSGLFGFFDGDPQHLLPLEPCDRATRLVDAMGGRGRVRELCQGAIESEDVRWALELATLLERSGDSLTEVQDQLTLAHVLRLVAQRTSAANIRNWCITRALALDGSVDTNWLQLHRFTKGQVLSWPFDISLNVLRVLLDPERADGIDTHVALTRDGVTCGLHFRNCVAVPTDGEGADVVGRCTNETWANVLSERVTLAAAISDGLFEFTGDAARFSAAFCCIDHPSFA